MKRPRERETAKKTRRKEVEGKVFMNVEGRWKKGGNKE